MLYEYASPHRPAAVGAYPSDGYDSVYEFQGVDYITFDRALTDSEVDDYGLVEKPLYYWSKVANHYNWAHLPHVLWELSWYHPGEGDVQVEGRMYRRRDVRRVMEYIRDKWRWYIVEWLIDGVIDSSMLMVADGDGYRRPMTDKELVRFTKTGIRAGYPTWDI